MQIMARSYPLRAIMMNLSIRRDRRNQVNKHIHFYTSDTSNVSPIYSKKVDEYHPS